MEMWQEVAIEALRKEILALITEQKSALIKAGPGKDKDVHAIVDDLHRQVTIRIDTIKHIESM
jgi:hypothetical protein